MRDLPRGTVTFLFTVLDGSTRLLKELRERYDEVLAEHRRLLRAAVAEHGGTEVDTQGDSFFVAFHSAKDAVRAAVAVQRALLEAPWPEGVEVRVRMALHTSEPTATEEGYVGLGIHRGARICAAGHGGQILLSRSTAGVIEEDELPGIELRDLGERQTTANGRQRRVSSTRTTSASSGWPTSVSTLCAGFTDPVRLFQLVGPELRREFAPGVVTLAARSR